MPAEKFSLNAPPDQHNSETPPDSSPQDADVIEQPDDQPPNPNTPEASQAETATKLKKYYQRAKRRKRWLTAAGISGCVLILLSGAGLWLWEHNKAFRLNMLTIIAPFVSIHLKPDMVTVSGGRFRQGDIHGKDHATEHPLRDVTIHTFAIGRFEVTFDEYDRFAMATGRPLPREEGWGRGNRPVINVSWEDAVAYATWLSQETGSHYRLPTESEWEYAAGNRGKQTIWAGTSDSGLLTNYAWFNTNSGGKTRPVGTKSANGLGLHDMSGNIWEWVEDCWHEDYTDAPTNGSAWLEHHQGNCGMRIRRGGGWTDDTVSLRVSARNWYSADTRSILIGFRLVQEME